MEKIKVLMVSGTMNIGGQENQVMNVLRYADKERFQIDYTTTVKDAFYRQEIESLGGNCILIPEMDWRHPCLYFRCLYQIMKKGNYDIVHSHELFHTGITLFIAYLAGVPCRFAHSHSSSDGFNMGNDYNVVRKMYNVVMRKMIHLFSTRQIACSTLAGKFLYGDKAIKKATYSLVFNSVDTDCFLKHYGDHRKRFFNKENWSYVLHVGHVIPLKNQIFLIKVAECLKQRKEKIKIVCVGPGEDDYLNILKEDIGKKCLQDYIELIGIRTDIDVLMREADAFVLPSLYEGMPLVLIEAQASGLPCVVANTFSNEVDFGINLINWMELDEGVDAWTSALEMAVKQEKARKEDVEYAINKFNFDVKMFVNIICKLYEEDYVSRGKKK